jgi:DNA-binding transcriptional MerR regulator
MVTIKQVAAQLGVHPGTLRNWERAGLIAPATRRRGLRVYSVNDVEDIKRAVLTTPTPREVPIER